MKREILDRILATQQAKQPLALLTWLQDGRQRLVSPPNAAGDGSDLPAELAEAVQRALRDDRSGVVQQQGQAVFVQVFNPPLRLFIVGRFPEDQKNAVDYAYMGRLARAFPGSFISAVVAQKNDTAPGGEMIDHLATAQTGGTTYSLHVNQLRGFDELFGGLDDPELAVVRRRHEYEAGLAAVRGGKRSEALEHFGSVAAFDRHFWKAHVLRALVFAAGSGERAARIHEGATSGLRSLRDRVRPG